MHPSCSVPASHSRSHRERRPTVPLIMLYDVADVVVVCVLSTEFAKYVSDVVVRTAHWHILPVELVELANNTQLGNAPTNLGIGQCDWACRRPSVGRNVVGVAAVTRGSRGVGQGVSPALCAAPVEPLQVQPATVPST